jgi:hypothetical protein
MTNLATEDTTMADTREDVSRKPTQLIATTVDRRTRIAQTRSFLKTCRYLLEALEAGRRICKARYPSLIDNETLSQVGLATTLLSDTERRMQSLAAFHGSHAEFMVMIIADSEHIRAAARRLNQIELQLELESL